MDGLQLYESGTGLVLGRATAAKPLALENALTCPVSDPRVNVLPTRHSHVRVAACVLAVDGQGSVLLTRRAKHMRSFPCAWVLPGGGVDPGESPPRAASRELFEETGLSVETDSLECLCFWESVFPTTAADCLAAGQIKGHYLIVFFVARIGGQIKAPPVRLQESETDAFMWVPNTCNLSAYAARGNKGGSDVVSVPFVTIGGNGSCRDASDSTISLADLAQIYPSPDGRLQGMGEAHLFALREWIAGLGGATR